MSRESRSPNAGSSPSARTLVVEWLVVGSILASLAATFVAVAAFLDNGAKRHKPPELPEQPIVARSAAPGPAPAPPAAKPAATQTVTNLPDTSSDRARELEGRIARARQQKAKNDLLAWSARKAADWLNARSKQAEASAGQALAQGEKDAADAARMQNHGSNLADAVARLELKRDDAKARLETARNRKGFSILPYRGLSGAWQRPLPIECARDSAQIMPGGPTFRLIDLELSGLSSNSLFARIAELAIRKAAAQATPDGNAPTVYVLFIVRPSGIKAYYESRARLQAQGIAFGYELVGENTLVDYPDLGDLSEWPGYVPPEDIADALAAEPIEKRLDGASTFGEAATRSGNSPAIGSENGSGDRADGLFVWREGLDGKRSMPGIGRNSPGLPAGMADKPTNPGGTGVSGTAPGTGSEPRVDFGPGATGQPGRPGGIGRGPGFPGLTETGQPGGTSTSPGTFEDLVAELAARDGSEKPRLSTRPGAVAILPGDLADDQEFSSQSPLRKGGGGPGLMPRNVAEGIGGVASGLRNGTPPPPAALGGRSPFGTSTPSLPRFEPAPGPDGASATKGDAAKTPNGLSRPGLSGLASGMPSASEPAEPNAAGGQSGNSNAAEGYERSGSAAVSASNSGDTASGPNQANAARAAKPATPSASDAASAGSEGAGMPAAGGQAGQPSGEQPRFGLRNSVRRLFGSDDRLPEKAWEANLTCDADGITIRPGEHRLSLKDMQADPDLLPRTLQSMFERQVRENPERFWRPFVKYRMAAGGEPLMGLAQQQLAAGFVRWPAVLEPVATTGRELPR